MRVTAVELRDFRNYERAEVTFGEGLTVVAGPNGAGKTNLLEAVYFACAGRSPRTTNERELVRHGSLLTRVRATTLDAEGDHHQIEVGFEPGEPKVLRVDDAPVHSLSTAPERPLLSVFLPDRLELVKGSPGPRRAHLDHLVAALWPARGEVRSLYSRALAQRNALLGRIRAGSASPTSLPTWDAELARHGIALMDDRRQAAALLARLFTDRAAELGLPQAASLAYRPRSPATTGAELARELSERHAADLERGFTAHGPHRDDLRLVHGDRPLRNFGSQGQQRVALLALLFAERDLLLTQRGRAPLMLLDDVMSELDPARRDLLARYVRSGGQALVTTTDLGHVPGSDDSDVAVIEVDDGETIKSRPLAGRAAR